MATNGRDPLLGMVFGDFRIDTRLGAGAMGAVYKATQISLERPVALKILPSNIMKSHPDFVDRFLREAKVAAQISHPNIVQVHAAGSHKGVYYIAMEYVQGSTLADLIFKRGHFPESKALSILSQAAKGLAAGERKNLIHRDIKPDNLMLTTDGIVKVADFGLAKISGSDSMVTQAGQILGTPAFMSPEQAKSMPVDARSDIYSLGATLFQMLTGKPPYTGDNPLLVLMKHCDEPVPEPRSLREDLSDFSVQLVKTMMAKDPADRFQSFQELGSALRQRPPDIGTQAPARTGAEPAQRELPLPVKSSSVAAQLHATSGTISSHRVEKKRTWLVPAVGVPGAVAILVVVLWLAGVFQNSSPNVTPGEGPPDPGPAPTALSIRIAQPSNGAFLNSLEVEVKGSIQDGKAENVTVNGIPADFESEEFSLGLKFEEQGLQTITVRAEADGRIFEQTLEIHLDTNPPVIRAEGIEEGRILRTNLREYTVRGILEDANIKRLEVNGFSVPFSETGEFSTQVTLETQKETPVELLATDYAGNSANLSFRILLDTTPPEVVLVAPEGGQVFGPPVQKILIRFSEAVKTVKVDDTDVSPGEEVEVTFEKRLVEGDNEVRVLATDLAGNWAEETLTIRYARYDPKKLEAEENAWIRLLASLETRTSLPEKIAGVKRFLSDFDGGKRTGNAKELLNRLQAELGKEEEAFREGCTLADAGATPREKIGVWRDFLDRHPTHHRLADVKSKIQAILDQSLPLKIDGIDLAETPGQYSNVTDGALMVYVPPGGFTMGQGAGPPEDGPAVTCTLSGYYIYVHEVTNVKYAAFLASVEKDTDEDGIPFIVDSVKTMGGRFPWGLTKAQGKWIPVKGHENHPVIFVSWHGAKAYAAWAGGSLPSEAQWERAAKGTKERPFPWGRNLPEKIPANLAQNLGETRPVGSFPKGRSPAGCFDMAGNVHEWCLDTFSPSYLKNVAARSTDPVYHGEGEKSLRGGSWFHPAEYARVTCRSVHLNPAGRFPTAGFRCVIKK